MKTKKTDSEQTISEPRLEPKDLREYEAEVLTTIPRPWVVLKTKEKIAQRV
jgi:hypothetical protein